MLFVLSSSGSGRFGVDAPAGALLCEELAEFDRDLSSPFLTAPSRSSRNCLQEDSDKLESWRTSYSVTQLRIDIGRTSFTQSNKHR